MGCLDAAPWSADQALGFHVVPLRCSVLCAGKSNGNAAIWALFPPKLNNRMVRTIRASQKIEEDEIGPWIEGHYERYFLPNQEPVVIIGEPQQMNQRLVAQMGTFMMPGVLDKPIKEIAPPDELEFHWAFDPVTMETREGFFIE